MWFNKVCLCYFCPPPLQFFSPLVVSKILLECGSNGRLNGEADVFFTCHQDAVAAMSRDRKHIGKTQNPSHFKSDTLIIQLMLPIMCTSWNIQETVTSSSSSTQPTLTRGEESRIKPLRSLLKTCNKCSIIIQVIVDTLRLSMCTRQENVFIFFSLTLTSTNKHSWCQTKSLLGCCSVGGWVAAATLLLQSQLELVRGDF